MSRKVSCLRNHFTPQHRLLTSCLVNDLWHCAAAELHPLVNNNTLTQYKAAVVTKTFVNLFV